MSLTVHNNISLLPYNTFGMNVSAKQLSIITSLEDLNKVIFYNEQQALPYFILGGGSNLLLQEDVNALILKNEIKGIEIIQDTDEYVEISVGGGEVWHDFVMYCVQNNYCGIENMALIPGTVGAAPIQNIGAYGAEVKDVIKSVHTYDLANGTTKIFNYSACQFGYRDSIFKRQYKNKLFIYKVTFQLNKQPTFKTEYGDIAKTLSDLSLPVSIQNIATAVIKIRQSKLPDPKVIGNSGSFFKNPEIPKTDYIRLKEKFIDIPGYTISDDIVKVPAGWLIEKAGWKGYRQDNYGVHPKQALVLVNYGGASGADIYNLSSTIIADIKDKFGITLEREVQVYPNSFSQ